MPQRWAPTPKTRGDKKLPPVKRRQPKFALGPQAAGLAVLRRGVFKTGGGREARAQHRDLQKGVEIFNEVKRQRKAHDQVNKLLSQGKTREAGKYARKAGIFNPPRHGFMGGVARFGQDLTDAGIYAPYGLYHAGESVSKDMGAAWRGDFSFKHSGELGKQIALSTYQDIRHPLRHPGYTFLDALSLLSAGAGTAVRVGAAGKAFEAAARTGTGAAAFRRGAKAALIRAPEKGGSLLRMPAPKETALTHVFEPGGKRITVAHRLEPDNPLLRPLHKLETKHIQKQLDQISVGQKPRGIIPA